ncbi:uncharacterized protein LOC131307061 [Rhododendron vialii]|uniref:uncharacterized protein LOC131307061 n=1 Tax=Rhododendron vialii TaxID=182163 RepID=UPI00265D78B6|nr:uncharacterized protein LOC131307061 [Rhododendron vialii]
MQSTVEHIARFQVQCGEAGTIDGLKLRLFPNSLIGTTFTWYINLPPNSVQTWAQLEEIFHQQFYRVEPEVTLADLSCYRQIHLESTESYRLRFKTTRFKCKIVLPEVEYASHYEKFLAEEQDKKTASKGTYYCDPNYRVAAVETEADPDVAVAKIIHNKPYSCKAFVKMEPTKQPIQNTFNRPTRAYTFDVGRAEAIFDQLLAYKLLKLPSLATRFQLWKN